MTAPGPAPIDVTGQRFGRLVVIGRAKRPADVKACGAYWLCKCDCGGEKVARGSNLRKFEVKSCGCLWHEPWRQRMAAAE